MKTGIYGGTFNPPHIGHVYAARAAMKQLGLDRMLVIPTGQPPHKAMPAGSPEPRMRLEMVRLAFERMDNTRVLDLEIIREGKSYTSETLEQIRQMYPDDELYLLMGTDMYCTLDQWYNAEKILSAAVPAVFERGENESMAIEHKSHVYRKHFAVQTRKIKADICPVSSSQIREELPRRLGTEYLQRPIYDYILKHRLYGVRPNFDHLRFAVYQMLDDRRTRHVAGCEQEAVRLALRWGEDVELAREAAILHDITKRCDAQEQLRLCEKYAIITDSVERREYKLLHAKTGAAVARDLFAVSDPVHDAIAWHTTGKPDMTLLEKIIYMADYIEPNRSFEGLKELRELAYENLDRAMILGLEMSMADMKARNIVPHANSAGALAYLKNREV